jgi:hypothetical protein
MVKEEDAIKTRNNIRIWPIIDIAAVAENDLIPPALTLSGKSFFIDASKKKMYEKQAMIPSILSCVPQ